MRAKNKSPVQRTGNERWLFEKEHEIRDVLKSIHKTNKSAVLHH